MMITHFKETAMKYLSLLLASSAFLMSACSTTPTTTPNAVSSTLFATQSADTVALTITRDSGIVGAGCKIQVSIDNQQVAALRPSESVTMHVPAGKHILAIDTKDAGSILCTSIQDAVRVNLERNDPVSYRIRFDTNGNLQLLPTL